MNSLEAEYSFLAPTWKLPMVGTSSTFTHMYGSSPSTNLHDYGPDMSFWNTNRYNPRYVPSYIPPTTVRRNYPLHVNYQTNIPQQQQNYQTSDGRLIQSGPPYANGMNDQNQTFTLPSNNEQFSNSQMVNRSLTYATNNQQVSTNQRRRVQIADQHHQSNSNAMIDHSTVGSERNESQNRTKPSTSNQREENHFGYTPNNKNIHDYLYGLAAPDPGSYANGFKRQQRRLQEEKIGRKSVASEYRNFTQNGGFGPAFGNVSAHTYEEKMESEHKRKHYGKNVREINQNRIEEQKRSQNITEQRKKQPPPKPKSQRAKEYAETIEKPHNLKPVVRLRDPTSGNVIIRDASHRNHQQKEYSTRIPIISPILITSLSNNQRCSSSESFYSSNLSDLIGGEFQINRSRRSSLGSSIPQQRRVRFHSRDFIRRRSSTHIDLPSPIHGKRLLPIPSESYSARMYTEKSAAKLLDERDRYVVEQTKNFNEKKPIRTHSMTNRKNMRLPPTATVVIQQTSKPSSFHSTTSTNKQLKKTFSKNDSNSTQQSKRLQSIPRKSKINSQPIFDFNIKSFQHENDDILTNE